LGEITGSFYFALIEGSQRIFGVDQESGEWYTHPFEAPHEHQPFPEGLDPKPLLPVRYPLIAARDKVCKAWGAGMEMSM
jgi:hypothetical protein